MSAPTRFPNGLTNVAKADPLGQMALPDPSAMHVFFDDFNKFTAADWVITTVEAGGGDASEVIGDLDGGVLVITNDAADNDSDYLQSVGEIFNFTAGKKMFFKSRFKLSDVVESEMVMGLQIRDTDPLVVSDGVFFQKDDGDALLDAHVKATADTAQAGVATLVNDTFVTAAIYYNGSDEVCFYIDGGKVATLATTNLPSAELTVSFGVKNGEAVAKILSVDYILVAKER